MSKSLYSLILNDDVVALVDKTARANGMSRSNMIDKILAEVLGYETPEIRANNIFDEIERLISATDSMRYLANSSAYMGSIMSAVDYRYNPAVKYSLELYKDGHLGRLKVGLRSQNETLIKLIDEFFRYYTYLEKNYYNKNSVSEFNNGKFVRVFDYPKEKLSATEVANLITDYVKDLDYLMNIYFNNLGDQELLHKVADAFLTKKGNVPVI